jgi:hypothetical protein
MLGYDLEGEGLRYIKKNLKYWLLYLKYVLNADIKFQKNILIVLMRNSVLFVVMVWGNNKINSLISEVIFTWKKNIVVQIVNIHGKINMKI